MRSAVSELCHGDKHANGRTNKMS